MRVNLADTTIGKQTDLKNYGRNASKFLIDNYHSITMESQDELRILKANDSLINTVIGELYRQAISEEKLGIFTLLNLAKMQNIPSMFLITWLDVDILGLKDTDPTGYKTISSLPKYRDQILLDISPHISKKDSRVRDITGLQYKVVRDLLCRNYLQFDTLWLSPTLLYHITKIYCSILANKIGRLYNLSYQETHTIATIFAVFFTLRCSTSEDVINPIMHKMDYLTRIVDTKEIFAYIKDKYTDKTFDMDAVIDTIKELSPSRVRNLTTATFFAMNSNLGSSQILSLINLEYPPYFTASLLGALSGDKGSIYFFIKNLNLRKDADALSKEILKTSSFIRNTH